CGFCTPGMLMTLTEFLRDNPNPTERGGRIAISGNLCRCTGYQGIVAAALDAAKRLQGQTNPSACLQAGGSRDRKGSIPGPRDSLSRGWILDRARDRVRYHSTRPHSNRSIRTV